MTTSTTTNRPPLDQLIDEASKLPPGPDAWARSSKRYPEISIDELVAMFKAKADLAQAEADELQRYGDERFGQEWRSKR
jgi:hypothetical protein